MAELFVEVFIRIGGYIIGSAIGDSLINSRKKKQTSVDSFESSQRAVLLYSSKTDFGSLCEELVNKAFEKSRTSEKKMKTCAEVTQYIQRKLEQNYRNEKFDVIIGENGQFAFAVTDAQLFAEIEQERYRVVIFNTKRGDRVKSNTHDANSQMPLLWK